MLSRYTHACTYARDIRAAIHDARWHTKLGADIYKHCVVARYTRRLSFNQSLITRAVRDIGEMGIAKSDARGFLERKKGGRATDGEDFETPRKKGVRVNY